MTVAKQLTLLMAAASLMLWSSAAHAQRIPGTVAILLVSPIIVLVLSGMLAAACRSLRVGIFNAGLCALWIVWFALASMWFEMDWLIWAPLIGIGVHLLVLVILLLSEWQKREKEYEYRKRP